MREYDADAIIIGAGAVGLASGYALAQRGLSVIVLEAGPRIGEGVSSRNSEVIHAGFYYAPGSLKARVCVEGRRRLYEFLESHGVPYWRCGKLVVATEDAEIPAIEKMYQQGLANDVEHLQMLTADEARALEPELHCVAAMLSPESGVFDSHGYMLALRGEIENRGGFVVCDSPFIGASADPAGGWQVRTGGEAAATLNCHYLVTAPGLEAQEVAAMIEGFPPPIPGALGTHYRKNLGGQAVLGPDLAYIEAIDYSIDVAREQSFYENVRRYWPTLATGTLVPDYAGIRPKIHGPGEKQPDFRVDGPELHGLANLVTLFGIESPGLTSSLAIGEEVADRLLGSQNNRSP
jgi:L-2-hydroxyglutarate oxidase LhgO